MKDVDSKMRLCGIRYNEPLRMHIVLNDKYSKNTQNRVTLQ